MSGDSWDQRTVIRSRDLATSDGYTPLVTVEGVSLPIDRGTHLTIDGENCYVFGRRSVAIDTQSRTVVTTITVAKDG